MFKLVTVVVALALAAAVTATAQTLESDGWTPVTSSQVVNLPSRYQRPAEAQQQPFRAQPERPSTQQPFRPKAESQQPFRQPQRSQEPEVSPYLPELEPQRPDYENQWDGFYGAKAEPTSSPQQTEEAPYEDTVVKQPEQSENDILQTEVVDEVRVDGVEAVIPEETEKPPLIIYPAASIDETPLSGPVDVQTPSQTVPDFLQPKRNQAVTIKKAPALQRFPPPGQPKRVQPPQPAGTPRQPLQPRPTPAQPPRIRGAPRQTLPPRGPPQQALPRNSVVGPPPARARPPIRRPPYPVRPTRPSVGESFLGGLKCASKGVIADVKLNDADFMRSQINCILEHGPCDKTGQLLKRIGPDVVRGGCPPPCDQCKKQQINKAIKKLQEDYPREFRAVMRKFNPRG